MEFSTPLIKATLIKRYKRFLADIRMPSGEEITVHCPNPGAMAGLNSPQSPVWISNSNNPKRKLRYTLELILADDTMVGINTNRANKLALEAMQMGLVEGISDKAIITPEQKYGVNSRIDFLVQNPGEAPLYVEVKNVHFKRQSDLHEFPDCVTARGTKHLKELSNEVKNGNQALMLFIIQRNDGDKFQIAADIDPDYNKAFLTALKDGVKAQSIACNISAEAIIPDRQIPIITNQAI